jgi:hypothetical protein
MAILTDKLIDGHEITSESVDFGSGFTLAREFPSLFCYLCGGPLARLHPLSYLFIFRGGLLTAGHSLVPFRYRSGVIARHALGQLTIRKDVFINISIRFLDGEGGEYPFEFAIGTVGASWGGHRRAVLI